MPPPVGPTADGADRTEPQTARGDGEDVLAFHLRRARLWAAEDDPGDRSASWDSAI